MRLDRIHHIAIICSDLKKSKDFYINILGLEVIREIYRSESNSYKLELKLGEDYVIELFSFPNPPARLSSPEAAGLRHLAFEADDVEKEVMKLKSRNIVTEPIRIDECTGKKFTFFKDPDDLPIELYER